MLLGFKYKLKPSQPQSQKLSQWLDMLRKTYNWCLKDRIDGWHQQFIQGDYCELKTKTEITPLSCSLVKGTQLANPWKDGGGKARRKGEKAQSPKRTVALMQDANLQELKDARPWYQNIDIGVLQSIPARVNESFNKFFKGAGFPKFKRRHDFKSFSYKPGRVKIKGNKIYLPKIGRMRFYNSRSIPDGFQIKTATVRQKADGWYVSLRIENLEYLAVKSGKKLYKVNPRYTSQTCSNCQHIDPASRSGEKFLCTNCGHIDDANLQAARNVKTKAIESYSLNIAKIVKSKTVRRDSSKPAQLSLFETLYSERLPVNTLPLKGFPACGQEPRI